MYRSPMQSDILMGKILIIGIVLVLAGIGGAVGVRSGEKDEKIVNSQELHEEMNEKRRQEGKPSLTAINGDTNTYARKDKSWNSVPDFFIQLIRGRRA